MFIEYSYEQYLETLAVSVYCLEEAEFHIAFAYECHLKGDNDMASGMSTVACGGVLRSVNRFNERFGRKYI